MVEAVVEYNYIASEPDELTIAKGDVIREIVKKPGGWWEGTLRDKRGMFPDNFVTVIQKEHKASIRQQQKQKAIRQCRAIFSYNPAHDDELKLNFGDLIDVLCEVEEGWWKGRLGHFEGVFPSNFVEEIEKSSSSKEDLASLSNETGTPNLPPKPTKIICQAKYPYDACNDDELTLKEGDRITLINKDGQDRGWWRGELRGRVGVFPDNFVVVLPAAEQNGSPHVGKDKKHSETGGTASVRKSVSPHGGSGSGDELKHTNVASQRKSLELKTDDHRIPPLPGKKPNVPKKSPSSAGSAGVLASLKHKLVDRVDGIASSRLPATETKTEDGDVDFDQVERSAMLPDMRANRAKAPGRRPPSVVYRDAEQPNLVNGNAEHSQPHPLAEITNDEDDEKKQPKVREWEKHKAPWVDELKLLNQGKRPSASDQSRLKPIESETHESKHHQPPSSLQQQQAESSTVDMSKSMSALTKLKSPTPDASAINVPLLRTKAPAQSQPQSTTTPMRPQSIHGVTNVVESSRLSVSPSSQTPSPKPPVAEKDPVKLTSSPRSSIDKKLEVVTMRQYLELQERILQMEAKMSLQYQQMQGTIDELKAKLQVETDMRRLLQSELEKVAQCVTQV